ncbi:MAG: hypothetical protein N5P05_001928 [Chroococcopsis gigantea SAG 12.99]|nr:hypothetical protein [Chroococcopsis gigantea SAG 12.99]
MIELGIREISIDGLIPIFIRFYTKTLSPNDNTLDLKTVNRETSSYLVYDLDCTAQKIESPKPQ